MLGIDQIRLDGGTQQRELSEEVVQHYYDLTGDGIALPPVEVVYDGKCYWLWDGFHRIEVAKRRGQASIEANVTKGSQAQAVYKSWGANATHGFPRAPGTTRKIIEQILTDEQYSKMSINSIARHVGVSRAYVRKVHNGLTIKKGGTSATLIADGNTGESKPPVKRASTVKVRSATGKTYEQKSQEAVIKDEAGREIPPDLIAVFTQGRQEILAALAQARSLRARVEQQAKDHPDFWHYYAENRFKAAASTLISELKFLVPSYLCVYCGGKQSENCKACGGCGYLNSEKYSVIPKEMKM
jgi:hypothetical protein